MVNVVDAVAIASRRGVLVSVAEADNAILPTTTRTPVLVSEAVADEDDVAPAMFT